ncbi:MAG: N-acetylglucosamine-specific PTS transporter subunit IIBC [Lactococcus chungangensis]|uniref:PTS system, N-acetylglucosamine-specific IIC component n=2 Tax=Pseudolactococcus chungangensis CAU 28 = DSM 22330 TaxID=1122154 RepID=A0A1K2HCA5_9LACT|nr:N-acetylglucosamine-specific PTS transporter subunit IIBC [Lactococcus chungangensis]MDD3015549.1 N-acetylglucosamine-specific PTS transporter subunit IIBC [Lactococcus chungangensis]SFZ74177.1 PTS system, N-acetylglucosamine-specific IIC component [Lactococcus chungangensis CAU 28 = DSM 22330]
MKAYMQRMGRSLMLPVATLPVAALFSGIGYWIDPTGWGANNIVAAFLLKAGDSILANLGVLFAVGLALGMSKDKDGASALTGLVAFLVPMQLLNPAAIAAFQHIDLDKVNAAFTKMNNGNVFVGILAGLLAAAMYNRFSNVKLPMALSFFSGKRCVPIVTAALMLVVSAALMFIWPPIFGALVAFGETIAKMGAVGAGLYGFFNRLLIPTGLHHALNNVFWFNTAGIDDIGKFWANEGTKGITGMYQAGFFPVMMFGLPAGAYAIYRQSRPEKRKATASLMLAAAFASFFTGVTEPLEFSFMFVAWPLYVVHAALTGISMFVAALFHWTAGFNFSAGLVDFVLSLRVPIANQPLMLVVLGLIMAVVYYFVFTFVIKTFNLMTPGREEGEGEEDADLAGVTDDNKFAALAARIYTGLGGAENVVSIDNCTTRLRLVVKDTAKADQDKIKATGVPGVRVIDKENIQVIVGTEVQFVADEMNKMQQNGGVSAVVADSAAAKVTPVAPETSATSAATIDVYSPAQGVMIPMNQVADEVFSTNIMGDGYAIQPTENTIYTPVAGKISSIFPTQHALGIMTPTGLEVLLHMGVDTVDLKGEPFTMKAKVGQAVKAGDEIAIMDLAAVKAAGKGTDIIVAFTNGDVVANVALTELGKAVTPNQTVGQVTTK